MYIYIYMALIVLKYLVADNQIFPYIEIFWKSNENNMEFAIYEHRMVIKSR